MDLKTLEAVAEIIREKIDNIEHDGSMYSVGRETAYDNMMFVLTNLINEVKTQ